MSSVSLGATWVACLRVGLDLQVKVSVVGVFFYPIVD